MRIRSLARVGVVAALAAILPTTAQAQWFLGTPVGQNSASDRTAVSFPKQYGAGQIIVSFGDRRLYLIVAKGRAISYPIAVPRAQSRWQGVERVSMKRVHPPWTPTPDMRRENSKLPSFVPGGHPQNPLGVRAIYLGNTLYRIHGTDAPWTIGQNVSKGCIRMHNEHVVELYDKVRVGMKVTATWKRFRTQPEAAGSPSAGFVNPFAFN
ncbi:MAG: L,D-transpeptidase [Hyphomicrobiaceae bacterium]|nr:L,D-transpeptidase [Hyphomicrobiaceae bacterium]